MLLARGKRQDKSALSLSINRLAAQPSRHLADEFLLAGKKANIRSAELKTNADRLAFANNDVGTHFARRLDRTECDGFGHDSDKQCAVIVGFGCNRREIRDPAQYIRILDDDAACFGVNGCQKPLAVGLGRQFGHGGIEPVAREFRHRFGKADIMGMKPGGEDRLLPVGHATGHADRFPAGRRSVVHGCIGNVAAEQPRDLGLEFEQHLERALRDFGLVWRIGRQELAALDQMIDAGRDVMLVCPAAQEERMVRCRHILACQRREMPLDRHFAGVAGQARNGAGQLRFGGDVDEQVFDRSRADRGQHRLPVGLGEGKITHQRPNTKAS